MDEHVPVAASAPGTAEAAHLSLRDRGLSSAHFLRLVEDQGSIGFWSADLSGNSVSATAGLRRVLGLPLDAALTLQRLVGLMHPDDQTTLGDWSATLHGGQPIDAEYRIIRPDGAVRWVRNKAEVVLDQTGRPLRVVGVVSDVTTRQEARHMAQIGHDRYQALVRAIAVVVWSASPDGATRVGSDWMTLTGQTSAEMTGYGWLTAIHPDDRARTREAWRSAVLHQGLYDTDYRVLCVDGNYRWFNARGAAVFNQNGTIREWVGVCLSIAGSKRFQADEPGRAGAAERITAGQVRAARALLDWSAERLASASGLSAATIARLEDGARSGGMRASSVAAVRRVLEAHGVVFSWAAEGEPGVRLARREAQGGQPAG